MREVEYFLVKDIPLKDNSLSICSALWDTYAYLCILTYLLVSVTFKRIKRQVSNETVVLRRWGVLQDNLVLSTGLIM